MAHEWSYTKSSIKHHFDIGLSVTHLMGHLGCLASHWSVPVVWRVSDTSLTSAQIVYIVIAVLIYL